MNRQRGWMFTSVLVTVAWLVTACGSAAPAAQAPTAAQQGQTGSTAAAGQADAPTTAAEPAQATAGSATGGRGQGDTLRLIWWQAPTILNPHLATGSKDTDASRATYEPLASFNKEGELVPFLAAEIPSRENSGVAADGKSVTWKLKSGVQWADGTPFTAADVVFTYQYVSNKETAATTAASYSAVSQVEAIDDTTIKVSFHDVNPAWSLPFVGVEGMILPRHIFAKYVGAQAREAPENLKPIGTGPYQVVDFKPGDVVIYEPNAYFREADKPYFSRVELKGGGDATSAARAVLQTGDADFAWNLQVEAQLLDQFLASGKGVLLLNPGGSSERILLNRADPNVDVDGERASIKSPHPFFTDQKVRQAFALAVDRETIAKQLYGPSGVATANVLVAPPTFASPDTAFEFNIQKAAALLDEAGWVDSDGDGVREKNGVKLQLLFQTAVNPIRQKTQEIIKNALESIGFRVELKSIDNSVFFSSDPGNPDTFGHFYADAQMYTTGNTSPDPGSYMEAWTCAQASQKANQWSGDNLARWCNPDYDALFATSKTELDPQKRAQIFIELNNILVEDGAIIPLIHRTFPTGASATLEGVELTPWDSNLWSLKDWTRKAQ